MKQTHYPKVPQIKIPQMEPSFDQHEAQAVYDYINSGGWLMEFKKTQELEKKIARFVGCKHCVITVNGTVSLVMALMAVGLRSGDEVIVPNLTMIATPNACVLLGIKPLLVDVSAKTLCLDLEKSEQALTSKTKAMLYVPLNGRSGNMKEVVLFCKNHKLILIEDAAQALGSYWNGKHLGTFGVIGSFSFSVPKIISMGQGGALITDSDKLALKLHKLKDFGRTAGGVDVHDEFGWNFKFTDLQSVIGLEQIKKLPERIKRKKQIYKRYERGLADIPEIEFIETELTQTTPWFIDVYVYNPTKLALVLKEHGVGTRPVYQAVSRQTIYKDAVCKTKFPVSIRFGKRGLWLPSSSKLSDSEIDHIVQTIRKYYHH